MPDSSSAEPTGPSDSPGYERPADSTLRHGPLSRLRDSIRAGGRLLAKEIVAFGVIGVINIVLNLLIYNLLTGAMGLAVVRSSIIATVITTTTSYFMNRHWSFSHRARSGLRREYTLFFTINGFATALESGVVAFVEYGLGLKDPLSRNLAKLVGIGLGTVIRFFAYKRWVFRDSAVLSPTRTSAQPTR